jgi:hypothetical protein
VFTLKLGLIAAYRAKADGRWTIRDASDRTIAEGRVPLDFTEHKILQPVPRGGIYHLDVDDSSAGWTLAVPQGRAATFVLPRGKGAQSLWAVPHFYFYVPRGTSVVDYYWAGRKHDVRGPDGSLLQTVDVTEARVKIPVPQGMDGKVWSLENATMSALHFYTVPNYVATAHDALLVPADVARADRLSR